MIGLKTIPQKKITMKKIKTPPSPDFRPLYVQVMEIISKRIEKGEWGPGEVLPAEPKFAEELGVSQGTVRKALDNIARKKIKLYLY